MDAHIASQQRWERLFGRDTLTTKSQKMWLEFFTVQRQNFIVPLKDSLLCRILKATREKLVHWRDSTNLRVEYLMHVLLDYN